MQRILSGERARCVESSEEFVTKKLCVSFIIVCAFFSVLGGFFLGRYATEKAMASQKTVVQQKNSLETLNQLSFSINKINNLTATLSLLPSSKLATLNYSELYNQLRCNSSHKATFPNYDNIKNDVNVRVINDIITTELNTLQLCYNNVSNFLEIALVPD
ncbi:hypothetical protein ILUMI_24549 [Ignelater luminosus]|uniref:Uncharacterized protein n=1 Tax=Ignelater luminosus TaxID=2038154 RepID=A0A8K0CA91_IGNLU|nr:hypothetical protein ILUMI_24549 [Ignelater luminosus]